MDITAEMDVFIGNPIRGTVTEDSIVTTMAVITIRLRDRDALVIRIDFL